jgi:asparagine synthase (glutamine-hydrolysing)
MCGIAGIVNFNGSPVKREALGKMNLLQAHRGPDGEGIYVNGPVGLGHRRLAIIDLTEQGKQPMHNEDKSLWLTFNGEIYNYMDLRSQLLDKGHRFISHTDAEVVIHAYEEWDTDAITRLNGMFAFGLWDEKKRSLLLVRDRLGVKPLFFSHSKDYLVFSSEIKAVISDPRVSSEIDYAGLSYYLSLNYMPAPHTLFKNVRQLLPGHYLLVHESGKINDAQYWDLVFEEAGGRKKEAFYVNEFNDILDSAVESRLKSDVPFGVFLSGGLDSSAIAFIMSKKLGPGKLDSFSVGFEESTFDELKYARIASSFAATRHSEQIIGSDFALKLPELVWHSEEPTADSSMLAVYYLSKLACKRVKMVLTGDGADEILAGYETYQAFYLNRVLQFLPLTLRKLFLVRLLNSLPFSETKSNLSGRLKRFAGTMAFSPEDSHGLYRIIFTHEMKERILSPVRHIEGTKADVLDLYREQFKKTNALRPLNRLLYVDTRFYLPNDMLVKVDRMTMAHGLEARQPFLDYRLVEFLAKVPTGLKLKWFLQNKYLLKKAMGKTIPSRIINRKKSGFNIPNSSWIRNDLKTFVCDTLSASAINELGFLDYACVNSLLREHFERKKENSHQIWSLLVLVIWWRLFIKERNSNVQ